MVKIRELWWNISPSALDRDVSLHAIIDCYGSRGGLSALVARRPRQPATRAGCKLLLFKTSSLFVSRAKSSTKLAEACLDLNLAIELTIDFAVDRQLNQKFHGLSRTVSILSNTNLKCV